MRTRELREKGRDEELEQWWEQYGPRSGGSHVVNVFVRSFTPRHGHPQQCLETLQTATEAELVDDYSVTILGDEVCVCEGCQEQPATNRIAQTVSALREWEESGLEASGFLKRSVDSSLADRRYDILVPPHLSLGIYTDDALVGVFPCTNRTTDNTHTPSEYLRRLDMPDHTIGTEKRLASADS